MKRLTCEMCNSNDLVKEAVPEAINSQTPPQGGFFMR